MEISVAKCQQMIDDAKAANRKLGVAYRCQYDPNHLECIRIGRAKELGDIKIVDATFNVNIGDPGQWRLKRALSGGGSLMDVGIYALQATRYLTGEEPVEVVAIEGKTNPKKYAEVDESMIWQMRFPSGRDRELQLVIRNGALQPLSRSLRERLVRARGPRSCTAAIAARAATARRSTCPSGDLFMLEMDDFSRCILENRQSKVAGEEGLRDVQIMMATYEAARTGRAVKLKVA